jgi:uncharacterized protein
MGKLLVLILLVVLAVWLIRRALRASTKGRDAQAKSPGEIGELVRCARCGVHLPRAEARLAGGLLYCGEEHARLGAGEG